MGDEREETPEQAAKRIVDDLWGMDGSRGFGHAPAWQARTVLTDALSAAERRGAERERESERKGLQLCNAVGVMMLACKRVASIQKAHAEASPTRVCCCETCRVALPDLSDEAVSALCDKSNAQSAALAALIELRKAERLHDSLRVGSHERRSAANRTLDILIKLRAAADRLCGEGDERNSE